MDGSAKEFFFRAARLVYWVSQAPTRMFVILCKIEPGLASFSCGYGDRIAGSDRCAGIGWAFDERSS
jgi:hypothetical protein